MAGHVEVPSEILRQIEILRFTRLMAATICFYDYGKLLAVTFDREVEFIWVRLRTTTRWFSNASKEKSKLETPFNNNSPGIARRALTSRHYTDIIWYRIVISPF
ncbi:hypothetical protein CVT26_011521 [Gymnopilus dilepis]|uniref:Uncharacterized protein n=1 Tax=Gymnopilus dilepis TaxID=231916 RepID=A0A409W5L3_9AGAR|nr:hypothetical protein CVT26_011521 [Gymnopilus dilepis]